MRIGFLSSVVVLCTLAYGCATPPPEPKTAEQPAASAPSKEAHSRTGTRLPGYDYSTGSSSVSETSRAGYEEERRINTTNPFSGR